MSRPLRPPRILLAAALLCLGSSWTGATAQDLRFSRGGSDGDQFGQRVASIGDLDGDGVRDLVVSASRPLQRRGLVRAHSGATGRRLFTIFGPDRDLNPNDLYGAALASAGDVDGDGVEDILVGSSYEDGAVGNEGCARVYSGATQVVLFKLTGSNFNANLGWSVATLGDLDGDGRAEFAVGAQGDLNAAGDFAGSVSVYSGATGAVRYRLEGRHDNERFGAALSSVPDVDGDGVPELLIGTAGFGAGTVQVHSGQSGALLYSVTSAKTRDLFGTVLAGLPDVNGDGAGDFLVGAPDSWDHGPGEVQLRSGLDGRLLWQREGSRVNDRVGGSVANAGDVNGDGVPDFLVGAVQDYLDGYPGRAQLYSGRTGALLYQFEGDTAGGKFGTSVAGLGDLDGDGLGEIAVSAVLSGLQRNGSIAVYTGNDLYLNLSSNVASGGDALMQTLGEAAPFGPTAQFITSVNGVPVFLATQFGVLDDRGRLDQSITVPPGLSGLTVTLRAFAQGVAGVVVSADELLVLR